MEFIRSHKVEILLGAVIILVYFVTRVTNILSLPIFTDEAIYVRWAQIAKQDAAWRFISLTDGKQPMLTWVTMVIMHFVKDPLMAGRLSSVVAGFGSLIGMFFLGFELFRKNKWIGILSGAVYAVFPFALVYDRMALQESLVCMFLIWGLYVSIIMTKQLKSYMPFVAGLIFGGGVLTKTTNFWNIYFFPFTLLLFNWEKNNRIKRLIRWVLFAAIASILAYGYYSVLRLSPYFGIIAEKNHTFYYPIREWLQHPLRFFIGNMHGMLNWLREYVGLIGLAVTAVSLFVLNKYWREKLLLLLWFSVPFVIFALIAKVLYPRYILYMTIFLIPLIALSLFGVLKQFNKKIIGISLIILFFATYLYVDRFIIFDFAHAPIATSDLNQYINSWPAGGGVTEMVAFFKKESANQKIYVASEGTFGSVPTLGVEIYLDNDKNIEKRGIYPLPQTIPQDLLEKAKTMPVFMVFEQTQTPPSGWPLKLIVKYQKGIGNIYMSIYQVLPKSP